VAEAFIIFAWLTNLMAFLWLNVIGCLVVMVLAQLIQWGSGAFGSAQAPGEDKKASPVIASEASKYFEN
jgi:hypothetical protein